ncbi:MULTISPECIES: DUF4430 domain-containing protein [Clostridium]|uniref:DUF4430 domain-containing protein n=1 Tax=Clostridium cibarium TaxID=2762247 RepID=A0ABR8PP36_9CLOT|nr:MULTISPECIES: DUF4430 domain-containing protein [Clostridium]MBD7909932.1 DUF4430 domain-containing protein [Clostridium cibarium]
MIRRYWKVIAICICVLFAIILGIRGLKIQTPEEVASNKVEVMQDESGNTDEKNVDSNSQNQVVNNESGNDKEEAQKSESNETGKAVTPASKNSNGSENTGSVESANNKPMDQGNNNTGTSNGTKQEAQQTKSYVNFSIDAKNVLNNMESLTAGKESTLGDNGNIFLGKIEINDGESVLDVLIKTGIPVSLNGSYIKGINNLFEKDCGSKSGWMYKYNGKVLGKSASEQKVYNGDTIAFIYTCDYGNDLR